MATQAYDVATNTDDIVYHDAATDTIDTKHLSTSELSNEQIRQYHEMGLGRGVDATNPDMWKNKSSFMVRKISVNPRSNIITTDECGLKEEYSTEVCSLEQQQQQIQLSLDEPTSQLKIGLEVHHSQSSGTSKVISVQRVEMKTIAFKSDFSDVPLYKSVDTETVSLSCPDETFNSSDSTFERNLCSWILKRIGDRLSKNGTRKLYNYYKHLENEGGNPISKLIYMLVELIGQEGMQDQDRKKELFKEIVNDCSDFLSNIGITHYVRSIKLGAVYFQDITINTEQTILKGGIEVGAGQAARGGIGHSFAKKWFQKSSKVRRIGQIKEYDRERKAEVPQIDAVIGFEIQSIDTLVKLQFIQVALRRAIKEYIQAKNDNTEGPFLVSCDVDGQPIYWRVDTRSDQILGTPAIEEASLFYLRPSEETPRPCDFQILNYVGDHRKTLMHVDDEYVKIRGELSHLPRYVTVNTGLFGMSESHLELKAATVAPKANFCLHRRVQSSIFWAICGSTPAGINDWKQGEQFFIKCHQHSYQLNCYMAMKAFSKPNLAKVDKNDNSSEEDKQENDTTGPAGGKDHEGDSQTAEVDEHEELDDSSEEDKQEDVVTGPTIPNGDSQTAKAEGHKELSKVIYKAVTQLTLKDSKCEGIGMLFRILPRELKEMHRKGNACQNPTVPTPNQQEQKHVPSKAEDTSVPASQPQESEAKHAAPQADQGTDPLGALFNWAGARLNVTISPALQQQARQSYKTFVDRYNP